MKFFIFLFSSLWLNLKISLNCNVGMWAKILASSVKHGMFVLAWKPFYTNYHSIHGWHYEHHLFMIGLVTTGIGFVEIFFDGLRDLPYMIEKSMLDRYLVLPRDPILLLALSKSSLTSWSDVIAGALILFLSGLATPISILFIFLSSLFFFSLYLYLGSLRFFIPDSNAIINDLYSKTILIAMQPNSSYSGVLKLFTHSVLPVCLISYFPIEYIRLNSQNFLMISILGGFVFHMVARSLFFLGLNLYESGNNGLGSG